MSRAAVSRGLLYVCSRRLGITAVVERARICPLHTGQTWSCHSCPSNVAPVRQLHLCSIVCAGHNKWSKVRHIKGPKDEARGRIFSKLSMAIRLAIKEGGSSNPEVNVSLAQVLEQCRNNNMPKASIETAIKNADKAKMGTQHTYEARGPGGCSLLIDVLTDNTARSIQEIKYTINKNGGALTDGARHSFDRKGVVMAHAEGISAEQALELAIEAGAEDVRETEDEEEKPLLQFICGMADLRKVQSSLEELGIKIASSGLEFVPHTSTTLPQAQLEAAYILIEALSDCSDVVRVWDNIQAQN